MSRGFLDEDAGSREDERAARDFENDAREVEISGRFTGGKTAKAREFSDGTRTFWVPNSQIRGSTQDRPGIITLRVTEWWAKKEGLM